MSINNQNSTKMKAITVKIAMLLMVVASLMVSNECKAQQPDTLNIPIFYPLPDAPPPPPDKSPVHSGVWGSVAASQLLTMWISNEIVIVEVRVHLNGMLIVTDDAPVLLNDTLCYDLSAFGNGTYTVELYADDQTVYIGQFNM